MLSKESDQRAEDYKLAAGTEEREAAALAVQNRALQAELDTARHQLEAAVIYHKAWRVQKSIVTCQYWCRLWFLI